MDPHPARLRLNNYDDQLRHVREQLASGEDPNQRDDSGRTALHRAIADNLPDNVKVIEEYIRAGADVNLPTHSGLTPLHFAVKYQKPEVVNALIQSGAAVDARDHEERSALHLAVTSWKLGGIYPIHPNEKVVLQLLTHEDMDRNAVDHKGDTALMVAVKKKEFPAVRMLARYHPNPNIRNHLLQTPLHVAFATYSMCAETILMLMGADICCVDENGQTPFDIFLRNPAYSTQSGWTMRILRTIAFHYNTRIIDILIQKLDWFPEFKHLLLMCSGEVLRMRTDFISPTFTVHDFVLKCLNENEFADPISQIYQPIVKKLMRDDYHKYFQDILRTIPLDSLITILVETVNIRKKLEDIVNPSFDFFSNRSNVMLILEFLDNIDVFSLIVAVTKVKIPETMIDLHYRGISVHLDLP